MIYKIRRDLREICGSGVHSTQLMVLRDVIFSADEIMHKSTTLGSDMLHSEWLLDFQKRKIQSHYFIASYCRYPAVRCALHRGTLDTSRYCLSLFIEGLLEIKRTNRTSSIKSLKQHRASHDKSSHTSSSTLR